MTRLAESVSISTDKPYHFHGLVVPDVIGEADEGVVEEGENVLSLLHVLHELGEGVQVVEEYYVRPLSLYLQAHTRGGRECCVD